MVKNKKTTMEHLARMIERGFEATAKKDELQGTREEMDSRFLAIENKIDALKVGLRRSSIFC